MTGVDFVIAPAWLRFGARRERTERVGWRCSGAVDVAARYRDIATQAQRRVETFDRLRQATLRQPFRVNFRGVGGDGIGTHPPSVARSDALLHRLAARGRHEIEQ